ncbi:hypothetical protein MKX07_001490 [Trichoderma sp. CBMAI-0711]|uniref:Uncharacterized protein n=1 Tax=Trichoderma parareesei TaxID=858221 RepID=A0A2H2ZH02_TRIPA|nr:hypothetical protein MKX07_001490 [Trichoderma sp. CBMAI-0711]OTA06233.1 hypothetical protein A9Z42_0069590 [Trichoderma parareesei]
MHSPKKDHQESAEPPTFKEQLDKEAVESRTRHDGENGEHSTVKAVVDKIASAIPASVPFIGGSHPDHKAEEHKPEPTIPPRRPEHDPQIEEFVRDQHRSNEPEIVSNSRT